MGAPSTNRHATCHLQGHPRLLHFPVFHGLKRNTRRIMPLSSSPCNIECKLKLGGQLRYITPYLWFHSVAVHLTPTSVNDVCRDIHDCFTFLSSIGLASTKIVAKIETRKALLNFQVCTCGSVHGFVAIEITVWLVVRKVLLKF
jgi:hypothetical protein